MAKRQHPKVGARVKAMLAIYNLVRKVARQPIGKREPMIRILLKRLNAVPQPRGRHVEHV